MTEYILAKRSVATGLRSFVLPLWRNILQLWLGQHWVHLFRLFVVCKEIMQVSRLGVSLFLTLYTVLSMPTLLPMLEAGYNKAGCTE